MKTDQHGVTVPEVGALEQWRRELELGIRVSTDFDPLWRAACFEARGRDFLRDGLHKAARQDRLEAARIIVAAVTERAT